MSLNRTMEIPHTPTTPIATDAHAVLTTLLAQQGPCAISDIGAGRPILVLHGGGGPATVLGLSQQLAAKARVLLPTHPGFEGTARPAHLASVPALASVYVKLLEALDLKDVIVIGSSIGGWTAAEMALLDAGQRIHGLVLMNAVGIQVPGQPVTDVSVLSRPELIRLANHNPERILALAPPPTPERLANLASNAAALAAYDNGALMMAPGLLERLADATTPAMVLWGESDGIASTAYGKAYAAAFAHGRFEPIAEAGHLPHIEQPARVLQHIEHFLQNIPVVAIRQ